MRTRTKTLLSLVAGGLLALTPVGAAVAFATANDDGPYVGNVKAGGECTEHQAKAHAWGNHHQDRYECRQTKDAHGKPCWLWKYDGPIKGEWTRGPAKCPKCPTPTASPTPTPTATGSPSPTTSPSQSSSPSASPSHTAVPSDSASTAGSVTPDGSTSADTVPADLPTTPSDKLPVTGIADWVRKLLTYGGSLLVVGAALVYLAGRRRRAPQTP